ncbi:PH domain-containing protein [Nocardia spumae]|uniref:PH domain-containing protein n=1 Tax=Nocardia spumae TaxID=2887190 RepID=UPI001D1533EA|nr:PH domain-containing protein [Nocardia spumae]
MSSPQQSVPPAQSSHTAEDGTDTGRVIRIPRLGHLAVFILLFCVLFPFFGWPAVLWILFLIPITAAWWVERTRTTVSATGLDTRTMFGARHIDWSQVKGLRIPKRGFVRVHLSDDSEQALPAVSYDRLKDLVAASGGRIPDPFAQPSTGGSGSAGPATGADDSVRGESPAAEAEKAEAEKAEKSDTPDPD